MKKSLFLLILLFAYSHIGMAKSRGQQQNQESLDLSQFRAFALTTPLSVPSSWSTSQVD